MTTTFAPAAEATLAPTTTKHVNPVVDLTDYYLAQAAAAGEYLDRIDGKSDQGEWYGDDEAARLLQCSDCYGMTIRGVMQFDYLLANFGIDTTPTDTIVARAARMENAWRSHLLGYFNNKPTTPAAAAVATTTKTTREPKAEKPAAAKDAFGCRVGSQAADINAVLTHEPQTVVEIAKRADKPVARVTGHLKAMRAKGLVDDTNALTGSAPVQPTEKAPRKSRVKFTIFGINACSILRWMGSKGWEFEDAALSVETLGCRGMSDATMKLHLAAGKKGSKTWGELPELTKAQIRQLKEASK